MGSRGENAGYPLDQSAGLNESEAKRKIPRLLRQCGWIRVSDNRWLRPAGASHDLPEQVTDLGKAVI